ncbi:MAG: hypothetical protein F6K31_42590 [Symploca sp. SIO2G7]|nr:hypothetical protein [Symploca sp. SIO2G7]
MENISISAQIRMLNVRLHGTQHDMFSYALNDNTPPSVVSVADIRGQPIGGDGRSA